jgi:hypothetical protein
MEVTITIDTMVMTGGTITNDQDDSRPDSRRRRFAA